MACPWCRTRPHAYSPRLNSLIGTSYQQDLETHHMLTKRRSCNMFQHHLELTRCSAPCHQGQRHRRWGRLISSFWNSSTHCWGTFSNRNTGCCSCSHPTRVGRCRWMSSLFCCLDHSREVREYFRGLTSIYLLILSNRQVTKNATQQNQEAFRPTCFRPSLNTVPLGDFCLLNLDDILRHALSWLPLFEFSSTSLSEFPRDF